MIAFLGDQVPGTAIVGSLPQALPESHGHRLMGGAVPCHREVGVTHRPVEPLKVLVLVRIESSQKPERRRSAFVQLPPIRYQFQRTELDTIGRKVFRLLEFHLPPSR